MKFREGRGMLREREWKVRDEGCELDGEVGKFRERGWEKFGEEGGKSSGGRRG